MKFVTALCGSVSLLAIVSPAMAQQAGSPATAAQLDTVVVTGSRIVRNGYNAPTPITVAPIEQLQQTTPSNIPDALNKLPQFSFSTNTAANGSVGGSPSVYGGNFLNLRAFGLPRTLILMDSRRVPSTSINGLVDINTLPQMLVQRVDVVTGGASAVYGSDAVTGVVNFVLDKKYNGLKAVVQGGTSSRSDANSSRIGVAGGGDVTDRGHVIWSAERYQNNGVRRHEDRPWAASIPVYIGATGVGAAGTASNPYVLAQNARVSNTSFGGLALTGPFKGQQFLPNGSLGAFNPGTPTTAANLATGGDGGWFTDLNMTPPIITSQAFGRFEYELTNNLTAYAQLGYAETRLFGQHSSNATAALFTVANDNPYLTAAEKSALGSTPNFTLSRLARDLAEDSTLNQTTDALNFTAGLTGSVFSSFKWDAYYTHGEARVRSSTYNNINYPNLYAAADTVKDASGNIVCRVSTTANAGLYPGCAPLNPLGNGNVSAAAKAFIYSNTQWEAINKLDDFEGNISGPAFNNWAGPVFVALNFEYRTQSLAETSNVNPLAVPNYSALLNKPPAGAPALTSVWAYNVQGATSGRNHVWETSAETVVPLLIDAPMAKSLEATGAIRYTDYSSSGATRTWKYGVNYQPINDLRIRWTESQDIRAPTLNDLYAPPALANVTINDPISGKSAQVQSVTGGNPNLKPEVARTTTVGFVYSPSVIPRLRMSLDYYNINIANALSSVNGGSAAVLQECANSGGASPVCAAAVRATPTSFPTYVTNYTINAAQTYTHGVDVEASYNFDMATVNRALPGHVDLRMLFAYQPEMKTRAYPNAVLVESAGVAGNGGTVGFSKERASIDTGYRLGPVTLNWQVRYYSGLALSGNPTQFYAAPDLPGIFYHDLGLNYAFKAAGRSVQAFLAVDNLLDQAPRIWPGTSIAAPGAANPSVAGDDMVGRYYTVGLRFKY
ncbi:MAG: TonB-dependent receptor [Caulobacteraceae bacterium]|nr:TonB-dependent receptor [Caulobacteraceae bacterium]